MDSDPSKLSTTARAILANRSNNLLLSHASIWELMLKQQIGKLKLTMSVDKVVADQVARNGIQLLPISLLHIYGMLQVPMIHTDPFDRLLIAQSQSINATMVTTDSKIQKYPIPWIW
jgi:PIN domain nuclease of toxin-antitoxin system